MFDLFSVRRTLLRSNMLALWFVNTKSYTLSIKTELSNETCQYTRGRCALYSSIYYIERNTQCILKNWCHQVISCPSVDLKLTLTMWRIIVSMDVAFENRSYTNYQIYSLCELQCVSQGSYKVDMPCPLLARNYVQSIRV